MQRTTFSIFFSFQKQIRLTCQQTIHIKCQVLIFPENEKNNVTKFAVSEFFQGCIFVPSDSRKFLNSPLSLDSVGLSHGICICFLMFHHFPLVLSALSHNILRARDIFLSYKTSWQNTANCCFHDWVNSSAANLG